MSAKNGIAEILESRQFPGVTGTRDKFGIGKEFTDERTGKTIDNWKSWHKAGFRPVDDMSNHKVKEMTKEKMQKLKKKDYRKKIDLRSLPY